MAKRKNIGQDRTNKQTLWVERTMRWSGLGETEVRQLLSTTRTQSFRINTLKGPANLESGLLANPVDWCEHGYSHENPTEAFSEGELAKIGVVYIQNAASWLPVLALDPKPGEIILDVCSAPGGKASHIQAITNNQSTLICNDNSKPRLIKLQRNMDRLGAHASYTLSDATKLSHLFTGSDLVNNGVFTGSDLVKKGVFTGSDLVKKGVFTGSDLVNGGGEFDKILIDAPCSGEGLMTLDDMKLYDSWSVAHIRRLSDLQKKILSESWQLLKPGGMLVYSTCTMAPEENEAVIDYFLRKNPDAKLEPVDFPLENRITALSSWNNRAFASDLSPCIRLVPSKLTEAFFVAKIVKKSFNVASLSYFPIQINNGETAYN